MTKLLVVTIMTLSLGLSLSMSDKEPAKVEHHPTTVAVKSHNLLDAKRQAGDLRVSRSLVRKKVVKIKRKPIVIKKKIIKTRKRPLKKIERRVALSGIAACIAKYESGGNPRAENPNSTASGLYQFIKGTWNNYKGYAEAKDAPVSVQTEKFYQVWDNGRGASQWVVSGRCGY